MEEYKPFEEKPSSAPPSGESVPNIAPPNGSTPYTVAQPSTPIPSAQIPPPGPQKTPNPKRGFPIILAGILIILVLGALFAWLAYERFHGPIKPAGTPFSSSSTQSSPTTEEQADSWKFPTTNAMWSIWADDFNLCLDGTITLHCGYAANGLSVGYLENCMTFTPPVKGYTVEKINDKEFLVSIEDGQALPNTRIDLRAEYPDDNTSLRISSHLAARVIPTEGVEGTKIDAPFYIEFSDHMNTCDIEKYLRITPDFPYELSSVTDSRVTVRPTQLLDYDTRYTVTISSGFISKSSRKFDESKTLTVQTEKCSFRFAPARRYQHTYYPGDELDLEYILSFPKGAVEMNRPAVTELYAFSGFSEYAAWLSALPLAEPFTNDETLSKTGRVMPQNLIGEPQTRTLTPKSNHFTYDNPGPGYYLFKTTLKDPKTKETLDYFQPLQIVTPSLYVQQNNGQALVWLNDSQTGQPLAGSRIAISQAGKAVASAVTGSDGSVVFEMPERKETALTEEQQKYPIVYTIYSSAGVPVYADTANGLVYGAKAADRFYSCFYLDRAIYRPTDTLHFWGFLKPYALNHSAPPKSVIITLDPSGLKQQVQVPVLPDGTYSGTLQFDQIVSKEYQVRVEYALDPQDYTKSYKGDPITTGYLDSSWIDIKEFQKPAYIIAAENDNYVYHFGDTVKVSITPTFYDGTPLPDYPIEFSLFNPESGELESIQTLTTDAEGRATASFRAGETVFGKTYSWTPKHAYYYIKIANDGEDITYRGSYTYMPGDIMLRPEISFTEDGKANLTVHANKITLDKIDAEKLEEMADGYYDFNTRYDEKYAPLIGDPVDIDLDLKCSFSYYEPVDQSYQSKKMMKQITLQDGTCTLSDIMTEERIKDSYFHVNAVVSYLQNGNTITGEDSQSTGFEQMISEEDKAGATRGYYLNVYKNSETMPAQEWEPYFDRHSLYADNGDTLRFALFKDGKPVPEGNGRMLYTVLQARILERGECANTFTLTQQAKYANNIFVIAAYFDGHHIYPVRNCYVGFNKESLQLNIETTTDKQAYMPGDKATVTAHVTDQNGKPVAGRFCFSVVDESVFALREQYISLLDELYGSMYFYSYYIYKYTSLTGYVSPYNDGGDGGKGNGDNIAAYDMFRKNFKDTAYFYPTSTDANGVATCTFTLPDNITSWRITTLAVGDNLSGGSAKSNLITTMPFFIKPVVSSKYIAGDEVAMLVQGHGTALGEDSSIKYTVHIIGDGVDDTQTFTENARVPVTVRFGKLPEGEYVVTSTAECGDMRDTVEWPIAVISSNLELVVNREIDLQQPIDIKAVRTPVVITMYDKEYEPYYRCISTLLLQYCQGTDQRTARFIAKRAIAKNAGAETLPQHLSVSDDTLSGIQNADGGIGRYQGADSDIVLTSKLVLVAKDQINPARAQKYLEKVIGDDSRLPSEKAIAYLGLAALDSSYTQKIHAYMESESGLSLLDNLYLTAGLAYGGDTAGAAALYNQLVTPTLRSTGDQKQMILPDEPGRKWSSETATAAAWLTASKLGLADADAFALHFGQYTWQSSSLFECMVYIDTFQKPVPAPAEFTCFAGGQPRTIRLGETGRTSVTLNRSEMQNLRFENVPASVRATAYYIGEPEEAGLTPSKTLLIKKEITPIENKKFKNVITVSISKEASLGYYSISDWIPSNARLHSVKSQDAKDNLSPWVHYSQEGQKMYFEFYHSSKNDETLQIEYYTQKTFDVPAMIDRTYLVSAESGENAQTERSTTD